MSDKTKGLLQLVVVIAFVFASFIGSALLQVNKDKPQQRSGETRKLYVQTVTAAPGPYQIQFETTGLVGARADVNLTPQVSGRVIAVNDNVFAGGSFEADDILFEINPLDFELEVQRLEAAVAQARTAFNLEEAEGEAALAEWKILNGDKPAPALVARKPQRDEAWANLKSAKAQLENARLDLERTQFSFPYAGRVLSSNLEIGQYVTSGQSYGSAFNLSSLEVQASLEDQQLKWLYGNRKPDITISIKIQNETRMYDGFVKRNAASLDPQTRFASVAFGFTDPPDDILPGMFADLSIQGQKLQNVTVIPASALQKEGVIWLVQDDNTITAYTPNIVYANNDHIVVDGLAGERRVVVTRVSGGTDGLEVEIEGHADE